jgi:arylsulfatase A-like enzyme
VLAVAALLAILPGEAPGQAGSRPNVILLMADDLDVGSLNAAVEAGFLPRLSTLAEEGTWFSDSFVTLSLCCPSRATALTGQYPHNHGVVRNFGESGGFARFDDRSTLATWLRDGGYRTGHVGKYLNGYVDASYVPPGWDDWQALVDPSTYCMYGYTISDNGAPVVYGQGEEDYQTDVLASRAEDFLREWHEQDRARPFFLSVAPLAPHLESVCNRGGVRAAPRHLGSVDLPLPRPPSLNELRMDDKPRWMRELRLVNPAPVERLYRERIAALRAVDDLVGRLMGRLEGVGALGRTAVLFTSDNGYLLGQHRWRSKVLVYEESIRVPLVLRLPPDWGARPSRVSRIALNNDLAPTIADLAGIEPGLAVDGRSLLPALGDAPPRWRRRFLVEYPPGGETAGIPPSFAVREGTAAGSERILYAKTLDFAGTCVTDREQYDLVRDPFQLRSLHRDDSPRRVAQRLRLRRWLDALGVCGNGTCQSLEDGRLIPPAPPRLE